MVRCSRDGKMSSWNLFRVQWRGFNFIKDKVQRSNYITFYSLKGPGNIKGSEERRLMSRWSDEITLKQM